MHARTHLDGMEVEAEADLADDREGEELRPLGQVDGLGRLGEGIPLWCCVRVDGSISLLRVCAMVLYWSARQALCIWM